ncbi:MAG TPA: alpha/beta hydrolase [Thermoanaerobaculia bacterium]|nr:alpha/beta hydrolase [Thermoanaerobaculia bacterium]
MNPRDSWFRTAILICMLLSLPVQAHAEAQKSGLRFGLLPVGSTKLYYEVAGEGAPVVLLHGGWLNSEQWDEQFSSLSRRYLVVRYDFRGAGRSLLGEAEWNHYDDLAALLKGLGIERAHLVGLSAGGQIAIDFAITHPEAVLSIAIGASPLRGYDLGQEFTDGMRGVIAGGVADDPQLIHDRMWAFAPFRVASTLPHARQRLNAMIVHQNQWATSRPNAPRPKPFDPPPAARLKDIEVPTLVIVGDGEMPALQKEASFVAQSIPGARLVRVKDAGHFVNLEQPQRYNEIILDWLQRQERRK